MRATIRIASAFALVIGISFSAAPQEVTLSLEDYESLRRRANPAPPPDPPAPAAFALESSALSIRPSDASARVTETLTLSLYEEGFVAIPLSGSGSVTSVELGSLEGRITTDDGRKLVVRGQGRHVVTIESLVALERDEDAARSTRALTLELPLAGAITGTIEGTDGVEDVEILAGGVARPATSADAGNFLFVGRPGAALELRVLGENQLPDRAGLPLVFEAISATTATLSRHLLRATTHLTAEVAQGRLEELRVSIPPELEVVRLAEDDVGWRYDGDFLVLTPSVPIAGDFRSTIFLEGEASSDVPSPIVVPLDASRSILVTALAIEGDALPTLSDAGDSRRPDAHERSRIPPQVREAGAFVVGDPDRPPRWSITWPEAEQTEVLALQIDRLVVELILGSSGAAGYQCWAYVRSSGAPSVSLRPPRGFELVKATRDGVALVPGVTSQGLEVPLGGTAETQVVFLSGILAFETSPGSEDIEIPMPSASAPVARAALRAILPGNRRYVVADGHVDPVMQAGDTPFSFVVPTGFWLTEASWTALTDEPRPLVLEVEPVRRGKKWF